MERGSRTNIQFWPDFAFYGNGGEMRPLSAMCVLLVLLGLASVVSYAHFVNELKVEGRLHSCGLRALDCAIYRVAIYAYALFLAPLPAGGICMIVGAFLLFRQRLAARIVAIMGAASVVVMALVGIAFGVQKQSNCVQWHPDCDTRPLWMLGYGLYTVVHLVLIAVLWRKWKNGSRVANGKQGAELT